MRSKHTLLWSAVPAGLALALVGGLAAPAWSQVESEEADAAETIVVTAQYREQNLQDTPLSITAISAETLEARGQTSLPEIAAQSPNVTLTSQGASFGPSITASIRGVGQYDFNPAYEPGVGIYIDDIYLPTLTGAVLDLLDLERVEVLRGPQGTLVGRNSIGGAIRLVSRTPEGDGTGFVEATYGSSNNIGLRGSYDVALTDTVFARVSGVSKSMDGFVNNFDYGCLVPGGGVPALRPAGSCKIDEHGDIGYDAIRAMLRIAPNDSFDVLLAADYTHDDRTAPGEVLIFAGLDNPNTNPAPGVPFDPRFICGELCNFANYKHPAAIFTPGGFPLLETQSFAKQTFDGKGASATVTYELAENFDVVSITGYRDYESTFNADDDLSPARIGHGQNFLSHRYMSQEFRLNGSYTDLLELTVGVYYSDQETTYFSYQDIRYAPIPLQFVQNDPVNADSTAAFSTVIIHPFDDFNITAGVRYTEESKDYTYVRLNPDGTVNPFLGELNGATGSFKGHRTDYRASIDYRWSDALMTYVTVSTGFKGGGINPRPFVVEQVQPFGEEKLTAYEIGLRSDFWEDRIRANISAFFNDYQDIQLTLNSCPQFGGPGPCALPANAGDAEVPGIELELLAEPLDGLTFEASYSYLDFDYVRIDPATGLSEDFVAPYTPKQRWSVGLQYEADLGDIGRITPRIDAYFRDDIFTNAANRPTNRIEDFTVANARLTWEAPDDTLAVAFEATNLFDEYYFTNSFDLTIAGAGTSKAQPGRPFEWAVIATRRF